jgi:hypothetical protein
MGVDPEEQVAVLQERIHERLAELRAIGQEVRVGPGGHEGPDPEGAVREIDLTDGIDLTDAAEARREDREGEWEEDGRDEGEVEDGSAGEGRNPPGGLDLGEPSDHWVDLEGLRRRRARRRLADLGLSDAGRSGPRLLGDGLDDDSEGADQARPSLQEATDAVIAATRELISYERRLPLLLDAEPRRLSLMIVRWSGVLTAAVAISLFVAGLAGWLPRWWVLPAIICGGASYLLMRLPVHPPGDRHESMRPGSVVVAFGALLTAICAASGLPPTVLLLGVVAIGAGIWHVQQTPPRIGALPGRFR